MKDKLLKSYLKVKEKMLDKRGNGSFDTVVSIVISVVLGVIIIGALVSLFNTEILEGIKGKVTNLFNTTG